MNATPAVSVVIPTRNRPDLLDQALDSVARQTFQDFEVIVVDDCSDESPAATVERFRHTRLIRHDEPLGGPAARNTGIKASRGAYVALLDDDDTWEPGKLAEQVRALEGTGPNVALCYCWVDVLDEDSGKVVWRQCYTCQGRALEALLRGNFISMISVLIKREVFDRVGLFDESFPSRQDWEMWVRIAKQYDFICIPKVLAYARRHAGPRISTAANALQGYERFVQKYATLLQDQKPSLAKHLEAIGYSHLRGGAHRRAVKYLQQSIVTWPWSWKCWVKWCWARCRAAAGERREALRRSA